jgi:hypothetical protein
MGCKKREEKLTTRERVELSGTIINSKIWLLFYFLFEYAWKKSHVCKKKNVNMKITVKELGKNR